MAVPKGFSRETLEKFLNQLASDAPSPGGGAAAALTGALGVGLAEMVARINLKRKEDTAAKARIAELMRLRQKLLHLMDEDTEIFKKLSIFYKKKEFGDAYQKTLKAAASIPFAMAECTAKAIEEARGEKERTSRWLLSDLLESGCLIEAGFLSARLNVEVNLKDLKDEAFARRMKEALDAWQKKIAGLRHEISS